MKKSEFFLIKKKYSDNIDDYIKKGGFSSLKKIFSDSISPEKVIEEVKKSGLRGRGGAGFYTGLKWSFVPRERSIKKFLVCNADEGEPGTFKDRDVLFYAPYLLIEGMIIASYAIGAEVSYIYLRKEYKWVLEKLEKAIKEVEESGFLGEKILKSDFSHKIKIFLGAGAYICGEETALLESMEGKKGYPRLRPPYPATFGLFGYPTVINNVETLANVPIIIEMGGENYAKIGIPKSTGTRLIALSGIVKKKGVYEIEHGKLTLREIINDLGNGIKEGYHLLGVIPGGVSAPPLAYDELDISYDFESLVERGTMTGSGAVIVFGYREDKKKELLKILESIVNFFRDESCGKCTPCREGTWAIFSVLEKIKSKEILIKDGIEMISSLNGKIKGLCACPLGESCALVSEVFLKKFEDILK
ncbi:MAG: NADH-quinone oxidoreductase subunit NuoF [Candidatus Hydrothermales bacterium]